MDVDLPAPVSAFVRAVNSGDIDAIIDAFSYRAMVNDQLREYWDRPAIAEWVAHEIIEQRLTMKVRKVINNRNHCVVDATLDGNFDKRGLPDPLVVTFYFSVHRGRIVQLLILRNES